MVKTTETTETTEPVNAMADGEEQIARAKKTNDKGNETITNAKDNKANCGKNRRWEYNIGYELLDTRK